MDFMMHFIDVKAEGGPEVLFLNRGPRPEIKPNEVLIEVKAAGVNRADLFQRAGQYPPPKDASPILGLEVAGVVVEKGKEVRRFQIGDSVCALTNGGGYAEFCAVPETQCLPVPTSLDFIQAASLPETFFTVWGNVFQHGRLSKGESVLIHAGASGIGSTAIQLAKAFGARVFVTTSSTEKEQFCKALKADHVILYRKEDFVTRVHELTQGRGVDLVIDIVGGDYFSKNLNALAMDGRLVQISFLHGEFVTLDLSLMMRKRLMITGSTLRPQTAEAKGKIAEGLLEKVWPLFPKGELKPTVSAVFPLQKAADAHQLLESGKVCGKVVLEIG